MPDLSLYEVWVAPKAKDEIWGCAYSVTYSLLTVLRESFLKFDNEIGGNQILKIQLPVLRKNAWHQHIS